MLLTVVEAKYAPSDLPRLTREFAEKVEDREVFQRLLTQISVASILEEARAALLACTKESKLQQY